MKLSEFLTLAKNKTFWTDKRVICFTGDQYPLFFFQTLFSFLKQQEIVSLCPFRLENRKQLWETLEQSFLGDTSFYWLGNLLELVKIERKRGPDLVEILTLYRGPHAIAFFFPLDHKISLSVRKRMTQAQAMVELKNELTFHEVMELFNFLGTELSGGKLAAVQEIVSGSGTVSLDIACMLLQYLAVTNIRFLGELKKNISAMVSPELSLASLASAFFKKQERTFFSLWSERYNDYPIPFWTTYWSEQLWRAHYVVTFLKQNNFPAARRFSFRLPASFLRYDWRQCSLTQLQGAHQMLYSIDFAFKTGALQGSAFHSFDLLYSTYFLNKFS
ncbi:hypothetical protein KKA53_00370 [Candidatus Dependentiae bacterium]|nr:hypothetical protein [Candidatus Dependentiae bacterium]